MTEAASDPNLAGVPDRGFRHSVRAFRHRDFTLFWCGAVTSNVGSWLSNLTIPFVIFASTHSALWVGVVALFQFVPYVLLAPWAGVLADRNDRRRVLLVTQTGMALSAVVLWMLWVDGVRAPLGILAAVGLSGIFQGINLPTWQAFVNDLVPRADLPSAVALNSLQFNAARALGPALAGVLLAVAGPAWALGANAASFAAVLCALLLVRPRHRHQIAVDRSPVHRQFANALRYVNAQPGIRIAILSAVLIGLLVNPIFQFTVVFAGSVYRVGPVALGLLNAALGVGALLALPLMAGWSHVLSLSRLARLGLFGQAFGLIAFAAAPNLGLAAVALTFVGGSFMLAIAAGNTAVHMIVADHMRGRVIGVRIMLYTATFPIAGMVQGAISDHLGPRRTVGAAGLLLLVGAALLGSARRADGLRRIDDPHDVVTVPDTRL